MRKTYKQQREDLPPHLRPRFDEEAAQRLQYVVNRLATKRREELRNMALLTLCVGVLVALTIYTEPATFTSAVIISLMVGILTMAGYCYKQYREASEALNTYKEAVTK